MELLLNYEGSVQHPLAIGSIDNFLLELAVHPATLQVGRGSGRGGGVGGVTLRGSGWCSAAGRQGEWVVRGLARHVTACAMLAPAVGVLACGWVPCSVCVDSAVPAGVLAYGCVPCSVCADSAVSCCCCCGPAVCVQLHTSLGNMVVEYGALPKSNPNRTMLSVRDKQAGSLIDVVFK